MLSDVIRFSCRECFDSNVWSRCCCCVNRIRGFLNRSHGRFSLCHLLCGILCLVTCLWDACFCIPLRFRFASVSTGFRAPS
jgi:hypothetical protein